MKKIVFALALGMLLGSAVTAMAATNDSVQAVFAKFAIMVNGQAKELKTDPLVVDGTSYLPVREVANLVGYDVDYEDATRTIKLVEKNDKKDGVQPMKTEMTGRDLIELLAKKYPHLVSADPSTTSKISMHPNGTLEVGDKSFKLTSPSFGLYDISPLIDDGVLVESDLSEVPSASTLNE